jgi:Flp pilus assembly protein TadD
MPQRTVERLLADVHFALEKGLGTRDLIPMLTSLMQSAPVGSEVSRFARLQLGRQLLQTDPFRAASLARAVNAEREDDEALGLLGLALTLLGHFRAAAKAYRRACQLAPNHPGHPHNLGHLMDVALNRPENAVSWLKRSRHLAPDVPEIASSLAHALLRVGKVAEARHILVTGGALDAQTAEQTVNAWLSSDSEPACVE